MQEFLDGKFCVDCDHYLEEMERCVRPVGKPDPVTGWQKPLGRLCKIEKMNFWKSGQLFSCGPKGRYWERKN